MCIFTLIEMPGDTKKEVSILGWMLASLYLLRDVSSRAYLFCAGAAGASAAGALAAGASAAGAACLGC